MTYALLPPNVIYMSVRITMCIDLLVYAMKTVAWEFPDPKHI
jgi:hypothetical protein